MALPWLRLMTATDLNGPWTPVPESEQTNEVRLVIQPHESRRYFRLSP